MLLFPVREPLARFVSGVGTVYARSQSHLRSLGRRNCSTADAEGGGGQQATRLIVPTSDVTSALGGGPWGGGPGKGACVWAQPLDSAAAFERYSMRLLALIERSLRTCTLVDVGKSAFESDVLRHLLPQTVFAAAADPGARLFPAQIAAFQAGARRLQLGPRQCGGAPSTCLMNNTQEGSRQGVHRPDSMHISPRLRARIEQVFRMDVELLEAMHAGEMTEL